MSERDPDRLLESFTELTESVPRPARDGAPRIAQPMARLAGGAIAVIAVSALGGLLLLTAVGPPGATPSAVTPVGPTAPAASPSGANATGRISPSPRSVSTIPMCDSLPSVSAPADRYDDGRARDGLGNDELVDLARTWASGRPGFQAIWIDRAQHDGWITLAFTGDDDAKQAEAVEEFPDAPVVVVGVDWTMTGLQAVLRRVREELPWPPVFAVGIKTNMGVVSIYTEVSTPVVEERFAGEHVCVTVADRFVTQPDFQQPTSGDGWRLLDDEATGPSYRVGYAANDESYAELWETAEMSGERPDVDFEAEIVIWFGAVYGSSCPNLRLDDVVFDLEKALIYAEVVLVDAPAVCTGDANGHAYIVAVDRGHLPHGPFWIQLSEHLMGPAEQKIPVDEDLSLPLVAPSPMPSATPVVTPMAEAERERAIETALADPLLADYLARHPHGEATASPYLIPRGAQPSTPAILVIIRFDSFADDWSLGACDIYREIDRPIGVGWLIDPAEDEILARTPIWPGEIDCFA